MDVKYGIHTVPQKYVDDAFEFIEKALRDYIDRKYKFVTICWSWEIGEELEHGDYLYEYIEIIPKEEYWIYMDSTHPWGIPDRLIKFNQFTQEYLERGYDKIETLPVNMDWLESFYLPEPLCIKQLKELLKNSDRPRLIDRVKEI